MMIIRAIGTGVYVQIGPFVYYRGSWAETLHLLWMISNGKPTPKFSVHVRGI